MSSNIKTLVQFQDEHSSPQTVTLLATDKDKQLPMMSYIITNKSEGDTTYFAQTQSPALWLNHNATQRYEPSSLDTLERIDRGEYGVDAYFKLSQFYSAELLTERDDSGIITAPMTRPKAGSKWTLASTEEAQTFLSLVRDDRLLAIGHIAGIRTNDGVVIPIRLNSEILKHHILSAGTTGFGKSNTNVNLIRTAQQNGFCIIVYDMKPDYLYSDKPNDEQILNGTTIAKGLTNVRFWVLGQSLLRPDEVPIGVAASDLDPAKLAQVIFYRPGEDLQQEVAEQLMTGFNDLQNGKPWTIQDFTDWLMKFTDHNAAAAAMPFRAVFNQTTFNAVRSKINRPGRVPSWVDAGIGSIGSARLAFGGGRKISQAAANQLFAQINAGAVHVIRVEPEDSGGRSYALFLDYAMRKVAELRRAQSASSSPVLHLIDEAADIFLSPNRRLAQAMEGTLHEQIRKGRSLSIGFILSTQSAGDIPERIRHNLNSVIVFRHDQPKVLQEALPIMSDAMREMASKLQRGETLIRIFGTYGLLRCRMYQSPALLYKPGT